MPVTVVDISELSATQLANAQAIILAAAPFGVPAMVAAAACAGDESSWLRYANDGSTRRADVPARWRNLAALSMQCEHDAVAPHQPAGTPEGTWDTAADSIGLFQQRLMYGYSTPDAAGAAELMDPAESTRIFIRGSHGGTGTTRAFLNAPADLTVPQQIQWTQGSEFPTGDNYAPFIPVATQLVARFASPAPAPQPTDWLTMATADEVKQAFADSLAASPLLIDIQNKLNRLMFGGGRDDGGDRLGDLANQVAFLYDNEVFWNDPSDAGKGLALPYTKTAANFNDVRSASTVVNELWEAVRGGYSGATKNDNNVAGIWFKVDALTGVVDALTKAVDALAVKVDALKPVVAGPAA